MTVVASARDVQRHFNNFGNLMITTSCTDKRTRLGLIFSLAAVATMQAGCGGGDDTPAAAPAPAPAPQALTCDDSMKAAFKPDADTTVLLVKAFKQGDALALSATPVAPAPPVAAKDLCLVKLNVGPGNPGPAGAPSTSPGIGIEIWLPTVANWSERIHNLGNGGWAGGRQGDVTLIDSTGAAATAASEGAVVATSDDGHSGYPVASPIGANVNPSWTLKPDGTINTALWQDFSERALHEQAVKTKALVAAYYLKSQKFAYFEGCSTGGRQGYKEVQNNPTDYNGYVIGAPAMNWTRFITAELYPQIVIQRDLNGVGPTPAQDALVGAATVSSCDVVNGQHLGYIQDPSTCSYDPTRDASVLCAGTVGDGVTGTSTSPACLSPSVARAYNKFWFGQTANGTVPSPNANNGFNATLTGDQLWYGPARGAQLAALPFGNLAGPTPFSIGADQVAVNLQNSTLATPLMINASGNGVDGWKSLSYGALANAFNQGISLQSVLGNINTDNPDTSAAQTSGAKIIHYHGLSDPVIMPQGSINYYTRVANRDGGFAKTQAYDRLFLVPGMGHCGGVGTQVGAAGVSPPATANSVPLPRAGQFYTALRAWVESASAPASITLQSADSSASHLMCPYPQKATFNSGPINASSSYSCK